MDEHIHSIFSEQQRPNASRNRPVPTSIPTFEEAQTMSGGEGCVLTEEADRDGTKTTLVGDGDTGFLRSRKIDGSVH